MSACTPLPLERTCKKCGETKNITCFAPQQNGLRTTCRDCRNAGRKTWDSSNPEKVKERNAKRYAEERVERLARAKVRYHADPAKALWTSARRRSKAEGIVFAITVANVIIPEFCPVLGIRLEMGVKQGPQDASPSLDRIRPELGYVPGNVAVVSQRANRIKNNGTASEHEAIARFMRTQ